MSSRNYKQYTEVSYSGRKLKSRLDEVGVWLVKGEDLNADFGGHHYQPVLGYFEGRLEDVIRHAVELPEFWTWGGGGDFEKIEIKKVEDMVEMINLNKEKAELEQRLEEINKKLKR